MQTKNHEQQQSNHAHIQSSQPTTHNIYNDQDKWDGDHNKYNNNYQNTHIPTYQANTIP